MGAEIKSGDNLELEDDPISEIEMLSVLDLTNGHDVIGFKDEG